ncbi:MAG: formylmethanofuran dehydrogenase subunit C [Candidatus Bathyarchaeota archaeon]|nr:formylmethanofuran dehydrogenase subunit C [Candidatus Bathyarchaeota archaeon]
MSLVQLKVKRALKVPIDAPEISPSFFVGKSNRDICNLEVWEGNRKNKIEKIFEVKGEPGDDAEKIRIRIIGDVSKVKKIGKKMDGGSIQIIGNAGMHLGNDMKNGIISVQGNVGSWLGSNMRGGIIEVKGNAGDVVGSAYRGGSDGRRGGSIIVQGKAGNEVGCWMRGGTIQILGNVGLCPGVHMKKGTIYIKENCLGRAGAQMQGGKIILDGRIPDILPSFNIESKRGSTRVGKEKIEGPFYLFHGDNNEDGNGRLYVKIENNPQLNWFEELIEI